MGNANLIYLEDIKDLREKTEKTYVKEKLKTAVVGGFDKSAVLNFIDGLREQELKTRETFTSRITELTAALEALQKETDDLKAELSVAVRLKSTAEDDLENLIHECGAMTQKIEHDGEMLAEYEKKNAEYEALINGLRTDYDEVQSAKTYKAQYDELLTGYEEIVRSRDKYVQISAALQQENADVKNQNEKFVRENELLSENLSNLTVEVRRGGVDADMKLSAYGELQKYHLSNLLKHTESVLRSLHEMETQENEFNKALRDDLAVLRGL